MVLSQTNIHNIGLHWRRNCRQIVLGYLSILRYVNVLCSVLVIVNCENGILQMWVLASVMSVILCSVNLQPSEPIRCMFLPQLPHLSRTKV